MRGLWFTLGLVSLAIGAIGVFVPLLPTVPLLLLSAFGFARSSERLHHWLLSHPTFGPPITDWRERGAIGTRAKRLATVSILAAFAISLALGMKPWLLALQAVTLGLVTVFIWTRPAA
ncbi:MAG: YbaN family protein [Albidovulum sp.]